MVGYPVVSLDCDFLRKNGAAFLTNSGKMSFDRGWGQVEHS